MVSDILNRCYKNHFGDISAFYKQHNPRLFSNGFRFPPVLTGARLPGWCIKRQPNYSYFVETF